MWIDTRTNYIKVYESSPSDPFVKKMTWDPQENAWVLMKTDYEKIATIDPMLAACAVMLGDPVQTEAMAKFAEGNMSYAEMRGLC
jgi:hypothetical protein